MNLTLSHYYIALRGYNNPRATHFNTNNNNEKVSLKAFHITSDDPCGVYALSYADKSADAFIVLPTPALGNEYFIMSYNSH